MAISNFIPTLWSARLLQHLDKNLVFGNIVNRDYEGEIKGYGDTVKINQVNNLTIGTYTPNTDFTSGPETLDGTQTTLVINQAKFYNFQIDDVNNAQTNPRLMDAAMARAAYGLADVQDKYIASLYTEASTKIGSDAAPENVSGSDAYEALVDLAQALDEKNVPRVSRWVVVPPAFYAQLLLDDRFIKVGSANSDHVLLTGEVGQAAGFTVYMSNNCPNDNGSKYKIIAGTNDAITFAGQIVETEAYRMEKRFSDAVKGLAVYGAKVTQPDALAVLIANFS